MTTRSVLLKNESYDDYLDKLHKAVISGIRKKDFVWQRMKQNGMTNERETAFRRHCEIVGFRLPTES